MTEDFDKIAELEVLERPYKESFRLFLVDTNILVYAYENENSLKKRKAFELIKQCFRSEISLAVSNQNLAEFTYVTVKKRKLTLNEAKVNVEDISKFGGFRKIAYSSETILSAIDLANEFNMPFWDSLLAATMRENGIFNLYTENAKDFKMPWINAVNPFI